MEQREIFTCESAQQSAEHYNIMIWTIFAVGVALSLWILHQVWDNKLHFGGMHFIMSLFGIFVLFYCTLAIESFGQKKTLMYKIHNQHIKEFKVIKELPFFRIEWLAKIVLLGIFSAYVYLFWFIWNNKSLGTFGKEIMFLDFLMFAISLVLLAIILTNWIRRPIRGGGNILERFRKAIFSNYLRNYDKIIKKKDG